MRISFKASLLHTIVTFYTEKEAVRAALCDFWDAYRLQNEALLNDTVDEEFLSQAEKDKASYIADLVHAGLVVKYADIDSTNAKIQIKGDRAVVSYRASYTLVAHGKVHSATNESVDVYIKRDGQWRMFRESYTEEIRSVPIMED